MPNNLAVLLEAVKEAPLWVKEAVFVDLKKCIETTLNSDVKFDENEIYSVYVPDITFKGKQELETHEHNFEMNLYKYLASAVNKKRVIDITLDNFWTLEQSSKYLSECIKNELIKAPANKIIAATIYYLSGEIRIGEYVKRINLIDVNQLEAALRKYKDMGEESDEPVKMGEVLVELGFIVSDDINKILYIKDESRKRFIFKSPLQNSASEPAQSVNNEIEQQIQKLTKENNLLKEKLRAIFNIQNKAKC